MKTHKDMKGILSQEFLISTSRVNVNTAVCFRLIISVTCTIAFNLSKSESHESSYPIGKKMKSQRKKKKRGEREDKSV